tara:strand:+ start:7317 stop:9080 length:1764 start_codon:yes stop_codon:yes gene_type:complete
MVLCMSTSAFAQATLIQDVRVFDGEETFAKRSVLIEGNRIVEDDFEGDVPENTRVVTCAGCTLLPGLIDGHVHAYVGLDDAMLFGVTTVLDMFSSPEMTAQARARTASHANPEEADLHSAGILATAPGGHGTQFGIAIPTLTRPDEAAEWVAARVAEGSDYIKIVIEPGGTAVGRTLPTLDRATVNALVAAAHDHGKLAVVHASTRAAAAMAIEAGADGLVHFFADEPIDEQMLAAMREASMFVTPTFAVYEGFAGRAGSEALLTQPAFDGLLDRQKIANLRAPVDSDRIETFAPAMQANIAALAGASIPILAGSDAPNPGTWFGISLHRELELLVESGLSPTAALSSATSVPANVFGIDGHGRIADGAFADLLLVRGDPTSEIAATRDIVEVWKDGQSSANLRAERRERVASQNAQGTTAQELPDDGLVARFGETDGEVSIEAPFGSWNVSTDAIMGGTSTARTSLTADGSLRLAGTVVQGGVAQWAGIAWTPGGDTMAPINLREATGLSFRIRGRANGPGVMGFSLAGGQRPSLAPIEIGREWREVTVAFSELPGFDAAGTTMLLIGAFEPGDFEIEIEDIRLSD